MDEFNKKSGKASNQIFHPDASRKVIGSTAKLHSFHAEEQYDLAIHTQWVLDLDAAHCTSRETKKER